jgi:hypothetical protein
VTLGGTAVVVEHVGSTAVPGLRAKPIIDIDLGIPDSWGRVRLRARAGGGRLRARIREPDWHQHRLFGRVDSAVNLHVFTAGSAEPAPAGPGPAGGGQARPVRRRTGVRPSGIAAAGGGSTAFVPVPLAWRATSRQVCGLFPWGSPGQLPLAGAPIGRHQRSRAVVCFDHVSWFLANLIGNPSVLVIARPGLGKSTLSSKLMLWLAGLGYVLLIPGDTKPDYVELTRSLGGEVRAVARSGGAALNPCDPGGMAAAAARLGGAAGAVLLAEAIGRAVVCLSTLVELGRRGPVADYEEAALATALRLLYDRAVPGSEPLIDDLAELLAQRPDAVRAVVLDRGVDAAYDALIDPLQRSLRALTGGQFGDVFTRRVPRRADRPPAVSRHVEDQGRRPAVPGRGDDRRLVGDVRAGRGRPGAGRRGLAPRRLYCLTLDELWRVLRLGGSMPDRVNELTRLNRTQGVGQIMVTHSIRDLAPGRDSEVEGIEERAGAIVIDPATLVGLSPRGRGELPRRRACQGS